MRRDRGKSERLFRAAVTAFASLTRPSRNEVAQLEDLTLPLYDSVSVDARRFVAAVLSEVNHPPTALVRRLADESVDIAAPLLLRSSGLTDVDLITLIGRRGIGHARVIGKRKNLNPSIAQLVTAILRTENRRASRDAEQIQAQPMKSFHSNAPKAPLQPARPAEAGAAAQEVRNKLRAMMTPAAVEMPDWVRAEFQRGPSPDIYAKLRGTALTGVRELFQTALADALGIDFHQARSIAAPSNLADLLAAFRYLALSEEQAFMIAATLYPAQFGHAEAVRLFLERYHLLHREAAADKLRGWKEATLAAALSRPETAEQAAIHAPANSPGKPLAFGRALKAS